MNPTLCHERVALQYPGTCTRARAYHATPRIILSFARSFVKYEYVFPPKRSKAVNSEIRKVPRLRKAPPTLQTWPGRASPERAGKSRNESRRPGATRPLFFRISQKAPRDVPGCPEHRRVSPMARVSRIRRSLTYQSAVSKSTRKRGSIFIRNSKKQGRVQFPVFNPTTSVFLST